MTTVVSNAPISRNEQSLAENRLQQCVAELRGQRILVTGAAGFIGGALLRRLAVHQLDVVGTVLYPKERQELRSAGFEAELLDLADDSNWTERLAGIDVVFNIAAMFQETEQGAKDYDAVNHRGAVKLAQEAARAGVKRFVHCSTVGVHGSVKEIPAKETSPFNPMDVYHKTKLKGELAILQFARSLPEDGMVVTVNRPAMVYGPGDLRMLKLFKAILNGSFRMIGSGQTLAHLGYIDDQTDSFLLCATAPRENVHAQSFNIASDRPTTLNELAGLIAETGGVQLSKFHIPFLPAWTLGLICEALSQPFRIRPLLSRRRIGFFSHNRAFDLTKARNKLQYASQWDHATGIEATIAWYRERRLL